MMRLNLTMQYNTSRLNEWKRTRLFSIKHARSQCEDANAMRNVVRKYLHALSIIIQKKEEKGDKSRNAGCLCARKNPAAENFSRLEERKEGGGRRRRRTRGGNASVIVLFLITPRDEARERMRQRAEREGGGETERSGGLLAITLRGK